MSTPIENPLNAQPKQFLIGTKGPNTSVLNEVLAHVASDPQAKVVRVLGPADNPQNLVVRLTPKGAETLRNTFSDRIVVEDDTSLQLF
jgi:hypothetical protein